MSGKKPFVNLGIGIGIGIGTDITNVIISSSIGPIDPKLSRVVTQDERTPPTKSRDSSISWSREKIKNVISPLSQGLWTPNLAGWGLRMRGLHPQSHEILRYRGHVTNALHFHEDYLPQT